MDLLLTPMLTTSRFTTTHLNLLVSVWWCECRTVSRRLSNGWAAIDSNSSLQRRSWSGLDSLGGWSTARLVNSKSLGYPSNLTGYACPWPQRHNWQRSVVASSHQPCYTNLLLPSASTASLPTFSHDGHGSLPGPSFCAKPTRLLQWSSRWYVSVPDRSTSIRSPCCSSPWTWPTQVSQHFGHHAWQTTLAPLSRMSEWVSEGLTAH